MEIENTKDNEIFEGVSEELTAETSDNIINTVEEVEAVPEQVIPEIPERVQAAEIQPERRSNKRILTGKVTSNKADKTPLKNELSKVQAYFGS